MAATETLDPPAKADDRTKRLNANISARKYDLIAKTLDDHGLKISDGIRIGLNIFIAALPILANHGEIVFRTKEGEERAYAFPFLGQ